VSGLILLADDEPEIHELLQPYLRREGFTLQSAFTGPEAVGEGDLSRPVPAEGKDEFSDLGRAFNGLVQRLAQAEAERGAGEAARLDLVANLSHDLRTPLASLRGFAEALVDETEAEPAVRQRYGRIIRQ